MSDPEAQWKEADSDQGGMILFDEFCEWAINKNLNLEDDDDEDEDDKPMPPAADLPPKKKINLTVKVAPKKAVVETVVKEEPVQAESKPEEETKKVVEEPKKVVEEPKKEAPKKSIVKEEKKPLVDTPKSEKKPGEEDKKEDKSCC